MFTMAVYYCINFYGDITITLYVYLVNQLLCVEMANIARFKWQW